MTEKQLKEYVLRLFKFKSISSKQFMIAKSNLEKIKENDPLFLNFNKGKLQTALGSLKRKMHSYLYQKKNKMSLHPEDLRLKVYIKTRVMTVL